MLEGEPNCLLAPFSFAFERFQAYVKHFNDKFHPLPLHPLESGW